MSALSNEEKVAYWRSLIRTPPLDTKIFSHHHMEELRAALLDAVITIESLKAPDNTKPWRKNWWA